MTPIEAVKKSLALADARGEPYVCATVELKRKDLRATVEALEEAQAEAMTHVTEWGLGRLVLGRSSPKTMREWELRADVRACDGVKLKDRFRSATTILSGLVLRRLPTCPRCAVLRDEALEGRLPARNSP